MRESQQDLEREIFVCKVIIGQLEQCLGIFLKNKSKNKYNIKSTLKDMQIMKKELNRLEAVKDAEMGAGKGAAIDHDELSKRSSKTVSQ